MKKDKQRFSKHKHKTLRPQIGKLRKVFGSILEGLKGEVNSAMSEIREL